VSGLEASRPADLVGPGSFLVCLSSKLTLLRAGGPGPSATLCSVGYQNGALAQLGEHLLCKQGVVGSIPTGSTTDKPQGLARADLAVERSDMQSSKEEEKVCSLVELRLLSVCLFC
jgi:hypothetical protein